ncbi:hypothetical protein L484_015789 [Morus notabilis]|uniref:Uncharacterized protein n=1 Tax=Morus notabilis TaxID=981085 RepID=W9QCZ0_9ROSA|nr:hypothetical protein L484_015789 [Morus notabilis]
MQFLQVSVSHLKPTKQILKEIPCSLQGFISCPLKFYGKMTVEVVNEAAGRDFDYEEEMKKEVNETVEDVTTTI